MIAKEIEKHHSEFDQKVEQEKVRLQGFMDKVS